MKEAKESTSQVLRKDGHRLTNQRRLVLSVLTQFPQSVAEISALLRKKKAIIDRVTIYRTLDYLVELRVAGRTQFRGNTALYELISENNHHHHLVCIKCGDVEDVSFDETQVVGEVSKHTDFQVLDHRMEFFGICGKCQEKR